MNCVFPDLVVMISVRGRTILLFTLHSSIPPRAASKISPRRCRNPSGTRSPGPPGPFWRRSSCRSNAYLRRRRVVSSGVADLSKRRLESRTWMQAAPLDVFAARGVPVDGAVVAAAQRSGDALRRFGRLEEAVVLEEAASGV